MANGVRITRDDRRKLHALIRNTPQKADELLRAVAEEMVGDIKLSFGTSPSAPGDPPGVDTGALRASMGWSPDGKLRILIHDGVVYGIWLEMGTSKMAARPFITPQFEEWRARKFGKFARQFGVFD